MKNSQSEFSLAANQALVSEDLLFNVISDVLDRMTPSDALEINRQYNTNRAFFLALNKSVIIISALTSYAKILDDESDFDSAMEMLKELDFSICNGSVGTFSNVLIRCDVNDSSEDGAKDFVLYDSIKSFIVKGRLDKISRNIDMSYTSSAESK